MAAIWLDIHKYPSTPHLEGSKLQPGDDTSSQVPYHVLAGKYIVVEEKIDGANSGKSFSADAELLLQCRGHYLTGGYGERHFNRFKQWAARHEDALFDRLEDRFLVFGEYCYAKHTCYYDRLPHYFLEFDIYDRRRGIFLSTAARAEVLKNVPVLPVPVLYAGPAPATLGELLRLIPKRSLAKHSLWRQNLLIEAARAGVAAERALAETWLDDGPEGLYIKVEDGDETVGRYKWVRSGFLQAIASNDSHWQTRPIIKNLLVDGADLESDTLAVTWDNLPFLPDPGDFLGRDGFRAAVLGLFGGKCALCPAEAVDAHHILDRKLFGDGGYYLANGAPLCAACHLKAEQGTVGVAALRSACGITTPLLAPGLFPATEYDKWGKEIVP